MLETLQVIVYCVAILGSVSVAIWKVIGWIMTDRINRKFVRDMAENHLPHVYDLLHKLCEAQGIEHGPPPPVKFVSLNGNNRKR